MKIKTFKELNDYLAQIPNIDEGGCGFSALFQYLWLKKYNRKSQVSFIFNYLGWDSDSFYDNSRTLAGEQSLYRSCYHILILYKGKARDCFGIQEIKDLHHKIKDPEFLIKALNNVDQWNCSFDRDLLPIIQEDIGINLPKNVIL